jgi:hypothetical protein
VIGWWTVCVFSGIGLVLELLHGFKVGAYLDVGNETRRLMWTLAHAHGTLLGLVHIAFAATVAAVPGVPPDAQRTAARFLNAATLLLPGGFFLGGIRFYEGDPGVGVALVPVGAALLLLAMFRVARAVGRSA